MSHHQKDLESFKLGKNIILSTNSTYLNSLKEFFLRLLPLTFAAGGFQLLIPFVFISFFGAAKYGKYILFFQAAILVRLAVGSHLEELIAREVPVLKNRALQLNLFIANSISLKLILWFAVALVAATSITWVKVFGQFNVSDVFLVCSWGIALDCYLTCQALGRSIKQFRIIEIVEICLQLGTLVVVGALGKLLPSVNIVIVITLIMLLVFSKRILFEPSVCSIINFEKGRRILSKPSKTFMKLLFVYGLPISFASILYWVVSVFDRYQIAYALGNTQSGIYSAAYTFIVNPVNIVFVAMGRYIQPRFFSKQQTNPSSLISFLPSVFDSSPLTKILIALLAISAVLGFAVCCHIALAILFRNQTNIDFVTTIGLVVSGFLQGAAALLSIMLRSARKTTLILVALIPSCAFILFFNPSIITEFGINGAAWSTAFSYSLFLIIQIVFLVKFDQQSNLQLNE